MKGVADAPDDRSPGRDDAPHPGPAGAAAADHARAVESSGAPGPGRRAVGRGRDGDQDGDVVRARPVRLRRVAFTTSAVVVVVFVLLAVLLRRSSSEGVEFGPGDQVAMVLLGVLVAAGVLVLARPSVVADLHGVRVQNLFTTKDVPWEVVRAVSFRDGTPWAMLDLADDDQIALLAVQAADGPRAVTTVRALRALHARHAAGEGGRPSTR